MSGPLSDLRAPLLQGLQLNYSLAAGTSPASGSGSKDKGIIEGSTEQVLNGGAGASVDNVPSTSSSYEVRRPGNDDYPPAVHVQASGGSSGGVGPAEEVVPCSCKGTCPHYHGNARPPKARGKRVISCTIHEITEEAASGPRQHVRCPDPACPGPDAYCKLCCPSFSCKHINQTSGQAQPDVVQKTGPTGPPAAAIARPTTPPGPETSEGPRNQHLFGNSRLHDQLYKGKGIATAAEPARRSIIGTTTGVVAAHQNAGPAASASTTASRAPGTIDRGKEPAPRFAIGSYPRRQEAHASTATDLRVQRFAEYQYRRPAGNGRDAGYEADDDDSDSGGRPVDVSLRTVMKLASAFFFIFSAMNSLSEYVTSLLPDTLGDESLFVVQTVLCASSLAAPSIVTSVGELRAMVLGGVTHVVYLLVLIFPSRILVLLSSAFCGFGASLVWVAQGAFLTKCSPPNKRGLFAGVFWGIYYLADIIGNLAAYVVFRFSSQSALFGLGAASAFFGVLLLFIMEGQQLAQRVRTQGVDRSRFLEGAPRPNSALTSPLIATRRGLYSQMRRTYENWLMAISFVLLTPMTIYIGFESAFWTGEFPKLFPSSSIGVVLLCTGVGQVLGAFALSWMSDYIPCSSPTLLIGAVASLGALLICIPLKNAAETGIPFPGPYFLDAPSIAYLGGFLFGVGDGVITSHMFAIIGRLFPGGRKPEIWGMFNLLGNGGSAVTYWLGMLHPLSKPGGFGKQILSQIVVLGVGTPLYMVVDVASSFMGFSQDIATRVRLTPPHPILA